MVFSVYELYQSLVSSGDTYTYDMYTAVEEHTYENRHGHQVRRVVVGITDGVTAYDGGDDWYKNYREDHFPVALLEAGVGFKCREGEASQPEDKEKIVSSIGDEHEELDNLVHGVMAGAAISKALAAGGERFDHFLQGLAEGKLRKLWVDCSDVPAEQDTEENMRRSVQAVDPETIEDLGIYESKAGGSWLTPLVGSI